MEGVAEAPVAHRDRQPGGEGGKEAISSHGGGGSVGEEHDPDSGKGLIAPFEWFRTGIHPLYEQCPECPYEAANGGTRDEQLDEEHGPLTRVSALRLPHGDEYQDDGQDNQVVGCRPLSSRSA